MCAVGKAAFIHRNGPSVVPALVQNMPGSQEQGACVQSPGISLLLWGWGGDSSLRPFT